MLKAGRGPYTLLFVDVFAGRMPEDQAGVDIHVSIFGTAIVDIVKRPCGQHPYGCGSKPMVPFWGRCTTHFSLCWWGLFTGGTIWLLTRGHIDLSLRLGQ